MIFSSRMENKNKDIHCGRNFAPVEFDGGKVASAENTKESRIK
ncbi:hypothetical protein HMPREF1985_00820 [Mitsuokella sp. oral taxon 131 str. W9106]|nr:hypothetical protein HMPREF1985_00820 [Mitsuokella sp. oral taxon 131 str. W9106]